MATAPAISQASAIAPALRGTNAKPSAIPAVASAVLNQSLTGIGIRSTRAPQPMLKARHSRLAAKAEIAAPTAE